MPDRDSSPFRGIFANSFVQDRENPILASILRHKLYKLQYLNNIGASNNNSPSQLLTSTFGFILTGTFHTEHGHVLHT